MTKLFLSYSRDDSLIMGIIRDNLRKLGFDLWIDIEKVDLFTPQWERTIKQAIGKIDAVIVLCSPSAEQSEWVNREISMARVAQKPAFPILIAGTEWDAIPAGLMGNLYYDMRGRSDPSRGFRELVTKLMRDFQFNVPKFDLQASSSLQIPTVQIINITGHVEGHIVAVSGDMSGVVNVAGRDVQIQQHGAEVGIPALLDEPSPHPGLNIPYIPPEDRRLILLRGADTFSAPNLINLLPPPFEWCRGQRSLRSISFDIAKYPITFAQFQVFIDAPDGFNNDKWWEGFSLPQGHRSGSAPQRWEIDNHPRENVSWYDAVAFTRWLSAKTGAAIRLPTESEWQLVAQDTDGRKYPWGNDFDASRCNSLESQLRQTTPVVHYPNGISPYGVMDMCGNVWEWCLDVKPLLDHEIEGLAAYTVKGGSWESLENEVTVTMQGWFFAHRRYDQIGFRIMCLPNIP